MKYEIDTTETTVIPETPQRTLEIIEPVMLALYREQRMTGDEMRDMAQSLQTIVELIKEQIAIEDSRDA